MTKWQFIVLIVIFDMITYIKGCGRDCAAYLPRDCRGVQELGFTTSGLYHVTPVGTFSGFDVWCDLETEGGGWLVFQRRQDGSVDFYRGWADYQRGFGDQTAEHWLGCRGLADLFVPERIAHYVYKYWTEGDVYNRIK